MAEPLIDFTYSDGTMTLTNGSDIVTGTFTSWDPVVMPMDIVFANDGQNGASVVKEVLSATEIRLVKPWQGPTLTNVPYFILRWIKHTDPRRYGLMVSEYLARLKGITPEIIAERDAAIAAIQAAGNSGTALTKGNNLSDLPDKAAARSNLGVRVPGTAFHVFGGSETSGLDTVAVTRLSIDFTAIGPCAEVIATYSTVSDNGFHNNFGKVVIIDLTNSAIVGDTTENVLTSTMTGAHACGSSHVASSGLVPGRNYRASILLRSDVINSSRPQGMKISGITF
jgi:hypothetical protein